MPRFPVPAGPFSSSAKVSFGMFSQEPERDQVCESDLAKRGHLSFIPRMSGPNTKDEIQPGCVDRIQTKDNSVEDFLAVQVNRGQQGIVFVRKVPHLAIDGLPDHRGQAQREMIAAKAKEPSSLASARRVPQFRVDALLIRLREAMVGEVDGHAPRLFLGVAYLDLERVEMRERVRDALVNEGLPGSTAQVRLA